MKAEDAEGKEGSDGGVVVLNDEKATMREARKATAGLVSNRHTDPCE